MITELESELDFIPISLATLTENCPADLELYYKVPETGKLKLYKAANISPTTSDLMRMAKRGVKRLYISHQDNAKYQEYLRDLLTTDDGTPEAQKARTGALNSVVRDVLKESFARRDTGKTVDDTWDLSKLSTQILCNDRFVAGDLFSVMHHDYTTFTHSANVAYYCTMIANAMSYDEKEVTAISAGALLHDIGKLTIPEHILCKPGKLDDEEFRVIKRHPLDGFRMVAMREDLEFAQLMMVYQHHERLDGNGYPCGQVGDDIHPWAKICTVADVFEALTSVRPYRRPMPFQSAIELMERDSGKAFEPEILKCWKAIISDVTCS